MSNNKIPFNDETLAAFKEAEDIRKHPDKYKSYNSAQEMVDDIIEKSQCRRSLAEIFESYNGNFTLEEISTGQPVGEEIIR